MCKNMKMLPLSRKLLNINNTKGLGSFKVYLIPWIWITVSLIIHSVHGGNDDNCITRREIQSEIMRCLDAVQLKSIWDSLPALTKRQWEIICRMYTSSMACVKTIPKPCPGEFQKELNIEKLLISGFGTLCYDDAVAYDVYELHLPCYEKNDDKLRECHQRFHNVTHDTHEMKTVCSAFDDYLTCDKMALLECGQEGMKLYQGVLIAQVPALLIDMCNIAPVYLPSKSHNNIKYQGDTSANSGFTTMVSSNLHIFSIMFLGGVRLLL